MTNKSVIDHLCEVPGIYNDSGLAEHVSPSRSVRFLPMRPFRARPLARGFSSIPWPRVGGEDLVVRPTDIFLTILLKNSGVAPSVDR